jgi:hypothetical protein
MDEGLTGTECRGEEHDVTIIWSVTSGKRHVSMDGKEIHYSASRSGLLDYSWTSRGNHVMKVIAHAAPPLQPVPGFRQYDLLIDGQSFFTMPKVYELGIKGSIPSPRFPGANDYPRIGGGGAPSPSRARSGGGGRMHDNNRAENIHAPSSRDQEETELQIAIQASLEESKKHLAQNGPQNGHDNASAYSSPPPGTTVRGGDLLDFAGAAPGFDGRSTASFASGYSAPPTFSSAPSYNPQQQQQQPQAYQSPPPIQHGHPVASPSPSHGGGQLVPAHAPQSYYSGAPTPPAAYQSAPAPAPSPNYLNAAAPAPRDVFGLHSSQQDDPFAPKPPRPPSRDDITSAVCNHIFSGSREKIYC